MRSIIGIGGRQSVFYTDRIDSALSPNKLLHVNQILMKVVEGWMNIIMKTGS